MVCSNIVKTLNNKQIEFFKKFSDEHVYNSLTQIIYKGQIPMAAYVLLSGKVTIKDGQKRIISECTENALIGFNEIYEDAPFKYTVEISPASSVLILPRSAIFEIQKCGDDLQVCPKRELDKLTSLAV